MLVEDIAKEVWDVWEDDADCDYIDAFVRVVGPVLDRLAAAEWVPGWRHVPSGVISNDTVDDWSHIEQGSVAFLPEGSDQ